MAAPGYTIGLPHPPDLVSAGTVGTSNATAVISGVAALVKQAFPWMLAPQLSDTLLTTATPIDPATGTIDGEGGVNSTYGWGLVNAAKAVHGPAQFAFGQFVADIPAGVTSTFANDVAGTGGLKLTGPGALSLAGDNTYQGTTEVALGALQVDGSITSDVTVDANGILGGTGTVDANVDNNGTVISQAGQANSGLTITGNLTESAQSTISVALGDPLTVGGSAALAGTMNVLGAPTGYTVKSTEPLLHAGTISGTFDQLTFASGVFYKGNLDYAPQQVTVTLTQVSPTAAVASMPLATADTKASAANLDQAIKVSNTWYEQGVAGHDAWFSAAGKLLSATTASRAVASVNSLSGEIYASSRVVEVEQSLTADHALANRQRALAHESRAGLWVQAVGADGGLARTGYAAMSYRAGGAMAGFDLPVSKQFSLGVAGGHMHTWANVMGLGGRVDAKEDFGALYARWGNPTGGYIAGRVSDARVRDAVQRSLLIGNTLQPVSGTHTDHMAMATLETGDAFTAGSAVLTPYVALTGLRLHQSGFAEQGSAMALAAPSQTHTASLGTLGLRYSQSVSLAGHPSWFDGYVAYRHVLSGADLGMTAAFVGVPGSTFRAQGVNLPRNVAILGGNWSFRFNRHWSGYIGSDYQTGSEGAHQLEANAGMRVTF